MKKFLCTILAILLIGGSTFIGIRMTTAPTDLTLTTTYAFPDFPDLSQVVPPHGSIKQAVAIDGQLAYTDHDAIQPTASTAKMLTALMVMEAKPFNLGESGETITINQDLYQRYLWYINNGGSATAVTTGEQISEYDALAAALLPSSNNLADTLAIWAFGSLDAYHDYTTAKLTEWGLADTTIGPDASGFSELTTSTAADLALIGQRVMENPVLAEIVGLSTHTVPVAGSISNTNQLLGTDGIIGVKTGYIGDPSGYCLVSAYRLGEHLVTVAVLGAPTRSTSFTVSQEIIESLQAHLLESTIITTGDTVGYYSAWWISDTPILADTTLTALGWQGADKSVQLDMNLVSPDTINADAATDVTTSPPNTADPTTGTLTINLGSESYTIPVSAPDLQPEPSLWQRFLYAISNF